MLSQTNIKQGLRQVNAGADLTDKECFLVFAGDAGSFLEVLLPTTQKSLCLYLVEEGAAHDEDCVVRPLEAGMQVRILAKGTGSAGGVLSLADPSTPSDAGKVLALPGTGGTYFSPGIAEEDFVDGQLVLARILPRMVYVATAFGGVTPANTAATNSSPYGFGQTQADALVTTVREMRAALIAANLMS